jgi:hypothetical protein
MKTYTISIIETLTRDVIYQVEANNIEEAREKALSGDTISEEIDSPSGDIIDRSIWGVKEGSEIEEEE